MLVGGHADNAVDLCGEDNADTKRQFLKIGSLRLFSVSLSAVRFPSSTLCTSDTGERICVSLLSSGLLFSFAPVCIAATGENIGSLPFLSASLLVTLFPFASHVFADNSSSLL